MHLPKFTKVLKLLAAAMIIVAVLILALIYGPRVWERIYQTYKYPVYQPQASQPEVAAIVSPTPVILPTVYEQPVFTLPGKRALLPGARWVPQTFNNCVPATASMLLQYFGYDIGQDKTRQALRTNPDDRNVFTYELSTYLKNTYGIQSRVFYNGNIEILKTLVANGFYVVVEDWLHPNEDIGHVTVIRGFDDDQGVLIADDSYINVNITYKYEEFAKTQWQAFSLEYMPVYLPEKEPVLQAIVGDDWQESVMYQHAVTANEGEVGKNPNNMYAWFNLGTSYFGLGDYQAAKAAFEKSRSLGWPRRMLWYQIQPVKTYNQLGEYQKALELAKLGLAGNNAFAELHLESAMAYKGMGNLNLARNEAEKSLYFSPGYPEAREFISTL